MSLLLFAALDCGADQDIGHLLRSIAAVLPKFDIRSKGYTVCSHVGRGRLASSSITVHVIPL